MHRQALIKLINDYLPANPEESETCQYLLDFVSRYEDCFSRELQVGHVTGSAWILNTSGAEVLLTHHRKLNIWVQPGGHADGDSDILAVAKKEAYEESGLNKLDLVSHGLFDIDIHKIPARKQEPAHLHYDCRFAFQVVGSDQYKVSDESHDLKWVPLALVGDFNDEDSIARMINKSSSLTSVSSTA